MIKTKVIRKKTKIVITIEVPLKEPKEKKIPRIPRYKEFLEKGELSCNTHGVHSNWAIYGNRGKYRTVQCKLCNRER